MAAKGILAGFACGLLLASLALGGCTTHCRGDHCITTTPIGWY